jgi:hypothetical protein
MNSSDDDPNGASGRGRPTMAIQALAFRAAAHIGQFAQRNEI